MSGQLWAREYIRKTHFEGRSPQKRARTRAFYASSLGDVMVSHGLIEVLPTLLHISLFLFFVGLGIFLFNINHAVFGSAIWSFLLFSYYYPPFLLGRFENMVPFIKTVEKKVSEQSWQLDTTILNWLTRGRDDDALGKVFEAIPDFLNSNLVLKEDFPKKVLNSFWNALNGYLCRILSYNITESAKSHRLEIAMKAMNAILSRTIPCDIFVEGWDQVPPMAEMVPGQLLTYCTSDQEHIAHYAQCTVAKILAAVPERDDRWNEIATGAFGLSEHQLRDRDNDSVSLSILIYLIRQSIHHRFCDWDALEAFSKLDIHHTLPGIRHEFCTLWNELVQEIWNIFDDYSTRHSLPIILLALINDITPIPPIRIPYFISIPIPTPIHVHILLRIRHLFIALHQGTDSALTAFPTPTLSHRLLLQASSLYRFRQILCYCPDPMAHHITNSRAVSISILPGDSPNSSPSPPLSHDGTTVPQQVGRANITAGPPSHSNRTAISEIGGTSHAPIAAPPTNPVHSSPLPADSSLTGDVVAVLPDITSAATLPMGNNIREVMAVPRVVPDASQTLPTVPIYFSTVASPSASAPASDSLFLNNSLTTSDAGSVSTPNHLLPALSVVGFSTPVSPLPSLVPPFPNAEFLSLRSSTTASRPTGNATLPSLRARGPVNTGSISFLNSLLQLLVHSPPFWNLFRELGDLKGQRGARVPVTCGATPLVDATARFVEELMFKEKEPPPTQQLPQQAAREITPREDGEAKKEQNAMDSFEPTYMYDAMKEKRQLQSLLVRFLAT
jgi:hypothetical protein